MTIEPDHALLHLRGVLLPEGTECDLYVVKGRITFQVPVDGAETVLDGGYLLPGLVDAHAHLALASPAPESASSEQRVRASAAAHLAAGVLLVREPGGPDRASVALGPHQGLPRVITAGRFLTPPGTYFPGLAREVADDELPAAAEEEARVSGAWAKVVGDWVTSDGWMRPNYRTATMSTAARRVHAAGGRIAIHATTAETVEAAIEAGFDSIEHALGLSEEHFAGLVERGIAFVPTLTILPALPGFVDGLGLAPAAQRAMLDAIERHPRMTQQAAEAGVLVLAGTDAGMGPHGMIRGEVGYLIGAGLPVDVALGAASWTARRFLGLPGLKEGAPADLVAYAEDPRRNPDVLARPSLRILDGRTVRS